MVSSAAIVLLAVVGVSMAQVRPVAVHVSQPAGIVHHVVSSQPTAYFSHQPAAYISQPSIAVRASVPKPIAILKYSADQSLDGSFNYGYESENGIAASASGSVKQLGADQQAQVVQGSYSYTSPDGTPITVNYVADENGFHAEGAHLPTPPPIPVEIARSLELLPSLEEFERQEAARSASQRRA